MRIVCHVPTDCQTSFDDLGTLQRNRYGRVLNRIAGYGSQEDVLRSRMLREQQDANL